MLTINIIPPFQTAFTIHTNCQTLGELLLLKYGKFATTSDCIATDVITAIKTYENYKVCYKDNQFFTKQPLQEIINIMRTNRVFNKNIFAIHGAAVAHNNETYLFLAATTSGKTTLTGYLTTYGFGYLTDDCILLDKESFQVYPFCTPVQLREGGYNILKSLGYLPDNVEFLNDTSIKRYVYTPKNCVRTPLPLKRIFFINRTENRNDLEDMNATKRMISLLKSPITEYELDRTYLKFISKLSKIPCHELYYCNMDYVAKVIQNEK